MLHPQGGTETMQALSPLFEKYVKNHMHQTNTVHQGSLSAGYGKKQESMGMIKKWGWPSTPWMKILIN